MGVVVSMLCGSTIIRCVLRRPALSHDQLGCIYVHNVATCLLSNVPPVCVFPYSVYSKMLAGSGLLQLISAVRHDPLSLRLQAKLGRQ